MKAVVTGGCGFIGSHVVDKLIAQGHDVIVVDNLSTGYIQNLHNHIDNGAVELLKFDLKDLNRITDAMKDVDVVFHLAANADVRFGLQDTFRDIDRNFLITYNVLEAMRLNDVSKILFSSSAAVYGEPDVFPTPEDYHSIQTSFYGASKKSSESFIEAFGEAYGIQSWIYRFVSTIGERHPHGVTYDFVKKLNDDHSRLEILGDGSQRKSYMHMEDLITGFFLGFEKASKNVNIFNIGHTDYIDVKKVADYITSELGFENVRYDFTGGKRGWIGDSPFVHLDISRLKSFGWSPQISIEEGIRRTVRWLVANPYVYRP